MKSIVDSFARWLPLCGLALVVFAPACGAQAASFRVLHTFMGSGNGDGADPWAAMMWDNAGNLYGTTLAGGTDNVGTVFEITPGDPETVLHSFQRNGPDGEILHGGLIMDKKGNLYGAATYGGDANGQGVIYRLAPDGTEKILYTFKGGPGDGNYPYGSLFMDKKGNLYGTTVAGGADNDGTVFKLAPDGTEKVLHSFTNTGNDGDGPLGNLVRDRAGNLYGTT
jgi:uncharacterized repeat protein (TIGR03803 family)